MKHALLVLDPQNDFFEEGNPNLGEFQATIPVVNRALQLFHERGLPVIFIQHTSLKKSVGAHAWEIHPSFACQPDDIRLIKERENAFWNSDLDATLVKHQVDSVIITGYLAEHCVLSTLRGRSRAVLSRRNIEWSNCQPGQSLYPLHAGNLASSIDG